MNNSIRIACGLLLVSAMAACGGDDDGGSSANTQTNPQAATGAVTQMHAFQTAFASADGASAGLAAYGIGSSAQGIVTYAPQQGQSARTTGPSHVTGTCECTETGCTFTDCGDDSGVWVLNGTIAASSDSYNFDLMMDVNTPGYAWTWNQTGDMTIATALVDGSMSGDGTGSFDDGQGHSYDINWTWDLSSNQIQLDDTGCAIGGSVDASVSYDVSGSGSSGSFSGDGSVTFGPACGQATAG